jgi:hypothetical protein
VRSTSKKKNIVAQRALLKTGVLLETRLPTKERQEQWSLYRPCKGGDKHHAVLKEGRRHWRRLAREGRILWLRAAFQY